MFRLISLLIVVAIMAVMWIALAESTTGGDCGASDRTTTSFPVSLPPGVEQVLDPCP